MPKDDVLSYVAPGEGESILVMTDLITIKTCGTRSGGTFVLTEVSTPPLGGPPMLHRYQDRETFYLLEGLFRFDSIQDNQLVTTEATPGSVIHIPSMAWHNYKNIGMCGGKMMVVLQPGNLIDFFRELGIPVTDKANVSRQSQSPDMNHVMTIMKKYEVEMLQLPSAS